MQGDKHSWNGI